PHVCERVSTEHSSKTFISVECLLLLLEDKNLTCALKLVDLCAVVVESTVVLGGKGLAIVEQLGSDCHMPQKTLVLVSSSIMHWLGTLLEVGPMSKYGLFYFILPCLCQVSAEAMRRHQSDHVGLESQMVVNHDVGAGNQTGQRDNTRKSHPKYRVDRTVRKTKVTVEGEPGVPTSVHIWQALDPCDSGNKYICPCSFQKRNTISTKTLVQTFWMEVSACSPTSLGPSDWKLAVGKELACAKDHDRTVTVAVAGTVSQDSQRKEQPVSTQQLLDQL
ncbi:hypothetical protein STEG23_015814, partial [Scotinomys teguina]